MNVIPHLVDAHRLLVFVGVQLIIAVTNVALMRPLQSFLESRARPRVSVLIPARDEEKTITACVRSLLAQDYPDFEIIVLDDHSTDGTARALEGLASKRLRVVMGRPLPEGWTGKTWACTQLAHSASGSVLFFTDADTVHTPDTVRRTVASMEALDAEFVTGLTHNEVRTLGEQVTVPFIVWSIMSILPLAVAYRLRRSKAFAVGNGKFLVFRREAYERVGGHAAVRTEAAEDLALSRLVKSAGMRWRMLDATGCISARMYDGFASAVLGFSKNFFALFDYRILTSLFVWLWMLAITWYPIISLTVLWTGREFTPELRSSALTIILSAVIWIIVSIKARFPRHLALLYPVTMTVAAWLGLWSMALTLTGRTEWKGRRLVNHGIRWI